MAKLRIEISEISYESTEAYGEAMPETKTTLEVEEVWSLQQLEGVFKQVALAAGFDYVGKVHAFKRISHLCEGDEITPSDKKVFKELLNEEPSVEPSVEEETI